MNPLTAARFVSCHQPLTEAQVADFQRDGFLHVPALFDREEADLLLRAARADHALQQHAYGRPDTEGAVAKLALWNRAGDDLYGLVARSHRVADAVEQLLGDEVYHWHSKMSIKEPWTGGAWEWHQDYGYWYAYGCLFPDLASVMIAVDPCTRQNGCLQVLRGSHRLGRIDHGQFGGQSGADPERVEAARRVCDLVYCEMAPGDALFFHSLTLHRSDQNRSPHPRWTLICCYNTRHNSPYKPSRHPAYEPLTKVPDTALKESGERLTADPEKFWRPA